MTPMLATQAETSIRDRQASAGAAVGAVAWTLRLEGGLALALAVIGYRASGGSGWLFALLFLAPDLGMLGYLASRRIGAAAYNVGHSYLSPAAIALVGAASGSPLCLQVALIWAAHIGFDRLLGYGLKYGQAFGATHLGWRGKGRRPERSGSGSASAGAPL